MRDMMCTHWHANTCSSVACSRNIGSDTYAMVSMKAVHDYATIHLSLHEFQTHLNKTSTFIWRINKSRYQAQIST